jgi:hypothetical protein
MEAVIMKCLALASLFVVMSLGCSMEMEPTQGEETVADQQSAMSPARKHTKCGPSVCYEGEFCCNESCGICAPTGSVCTQQLCVKMNIK